VTPVEVKQLVALDLEIQVERYQFCMFGSAGSGLVGPVQRGPEAPYVQGSRDQVVFLSGAAEHWPGFRFEVWTAEPPDVQEHWAEVDETLVELTEPEVRFWALFGRPLSTPLSVGNEAGVYAVRAYCRGRDSVAAGYPSEESVDGIEQWLVQIWPQDS
jgi:hypothetical protein